MSIPTGGMKDSTNHRLGIINNYLTAVVVLIALYTMAAPLLPQIMWWLRHDSPVQRIVPKPAVPGPITSGEETPQQNTLLVPEIGLQQPIHEGTIAALRKGVWHIPHSSSPDKGGNTVLAAHRFTYRGNGVFYHLDKMKQGDAITLYWKGKAYNYKVSVIKVVPPTEVSVEAPTDDSILTVYTCTPLWNPKDRLVVQAKLIEDAQ